MIRELLAELGTGATPLGLDALARRLGTSPAAVEGALELLVRKGRVVRDTATAGACDGCSARSLCSPLMGRGTRFIPVPEGATVAPVGCGAAAVPGAISAPSAAQARQLGLRLPLPVVEQARRGAPGRGERAGASARTDPRSEATEPPDGTPPGA